MAMRLTKTTIHLKEIRLYGRHGISEKEQRVGNHFVIRLSMTIPCPKTGFAEDELDNTINYAESYTIIYKTFQQTSKTLENLASRMLSQLFEAFPLLEEAEIEIEKLRPPFPADCQAASVRLTARRD